ncbi:MAG: preprotein translocase subunit SecG, partial [Acidobacteriota bacterium]|nr:preprotein translocase subunit SecG [Acidobacteriota bacterium]
MFTWAFIVIEAISAVGLVFLVLLHSGRGGGISEMMGGTIGQAA